jgi:ketosteroid isomerase-like protein
MRYRSHEERGRVSVDALIDAYCAAWNEGDPAARTAQLSVVLIETGRYTDPRADTVGAAALSAHIETVRAARPGARVRRATVVDQHHDLARFGFHVVSADGAELLNGLDVLELTSDGRIARIIGFFGALSGA